MQTLGDIADILSTLRPCTEGISCKLCISLNPHHHISFTVTAPERSSELSASVVTGPAVVDNIVNNPSTTYITTKADVDKIVNQISVDPELKGLLRGEGRADQLASFPPWLDIPDVRKLTKPIALLTKNGYVCCTAFLANVDGTTVLFGPGHCLRSEDDVMTTSQVIRTTTVVGRINLDDYKLNFGNLDGRKTADV